MWGITTSGPRVRVDRQAFRGRHHNWKTPKEHPPHVLQPRGGSCFGWFLWWGGGSVWERGSQRRTRYHTFATMDDARHLKNNKEVPLHVL